MSNLVLFHREQTFVLIILLQTQLAVDLANLKRNSGSCGRRRSFKHNLFGIKQHN